MGNTIKTGFWPPRDVTEQVQSFLADHDALFSKDSGAKIMVVYSFPSNYWREVTKKGGDQFTDVDSILFYRSVEEQSEHASRLPFWEVIQRLSEEQALYDVRMFGDDELRPDRVSADDWKQYGLIVLPECMVLTANQREELLRFAENGGKVLLFGKNAEDNPAWMDKMIALKTVTAIGNPDSRREAVRLFTEAFRKATEGEQQLVIRTGIPEDKAYIGAQTHAGLTKSLQLLNYRYDAETDRVLPVKDVTVLLRDTSVKGARAIDLNGEPVTMNVNIQNGIVTLTIPSLPLYMAVELF